MENLVEKKRGASMKAFKKFFQNLLFPAFVLLIFSQPAWASTQSHQFVFNGGLGVFVGSEGIDASFDISLEPEYFITEHNSLALRMDFTVGGFDAFHIAGRWRYYFDLANEKINIFVGLGFGGGVGFNGGGFGDAVIPVFGWQYDLGQHLKIGSDLTFDIIFNSNNAAFAARLMPVVVKWAF
jgi:hypothetical protein